jgi:hypothetical protein
MYENRLKKFVIGLLLLFVLTIMYLVDLIRVDILNILMLTLVLTSMYTSGVALLVKIFKIADSPLMFRFAIGSIAVSMGTTLLLFTQLLTYSNTLIMLVALQVPLFLDVIIKKSHKKYYGLLMNDRGHYIYYALIIFFFGMLILTSTEYLTPGDKYRWVAMKSYVELGGHSNISYDFRNLSPFYAETFLLLGMVLGGESLALMINILFQLFISLSLFDYFFNEEKIPTKISAFLTIIFFLNACFLIDAPRGYISIIISFFIWLIYFSLNKWKTTKNKQYFYISILFAGFAAGTKLHSLFIVLLLSIYIFVVENGGKMTKSSISQSLKKPLLYVIGFMLIASPWYLRSIIYTGDPIFPYLSKSFFNSLDPSSYLLNPHSISGVEAIISYYFKPFYLMLIQPTIFLYGWLFGILPIAIIPFYFAVKRRETGFTILFLIIGYYTLWFFTHQNVRYILYVYPILYVFAFVNAYYLVNQVWNTRLIRILTYTSLIVLTINGGIHLMIYGRWWSENKILTKQKFYSQYDSYKRCFEIDQLVKTNHHKPKIISNQRDLYYLETPITYANVFYDDIVADKNRVEITRLLKDYANNGYTNLIFYDFNNTQKHDLLIEVGARYVGDISYLGDNDVRMYEIF